MATFVFISFLLLLTILLLLFMTLLFQFTNGIFKVLFEANRGVSYFGDISIDDISFACDVTPLCTDQQYACNIAQCIPKYR